MLKTKIAASLLATALLAGTVVAQTRPSPAPPPAPSAPAMGASTGPVQFITNNQVGHWRGSKLMGVDIYGPNDEMVGDVSDLLVDQQGNINGVVIGVGGFLGIGEKDVAVPFTAIQWIETPSKANTMASNTAAGVSSASGSVGTAGMDTANNSGAISSPDTTGSVARNDANNGVRTYPDHGMISMSKDQLKNAPAYSLN